LSRKKEVHEMAERWFIIKHEECGSVFTINSDRFAEGMSKTNQSLQCPSCRKSRAGMPSYILTFLKQYDELTKELEKEGYTIREIKNKIDPKTLEL
jgi:hypothetical protein